MQVSHTKSSPASPWPTVRALEHRGQKRSMSRGKFSGVLDCVKLESPVRVADKMNILVCICILLLDIQRPFSTSQVLKLVAETHPILHTNTCFDVADICPENAQFYVGYTQSSVWKGGTTEFLESM